MSKKERTYGTVWSCDTCKTPRMTHAEFRKHAIEVHDVKEGDQFISKLVMAVDGSDWFSNTFELTKGDLQLTKVVTGKRDQPWG